MSTSNSTMHTPQHPCAGEADLVPLVALAMEMGATGAACIAAQSISAEESLAQLCASPRCRNYGQSRSCPPHVAGPAQMQQMLKQFTDALVVKIDVPAALLFSHERIDVMGLLHHIVSGVEQAAVAMGYPDAAGFAGSSCKTLFCSAHHACRALSGNDGCRHPDLARPSMSGFGINVAKLMQSAGWPASPTSQKEAGQSDSMSWVAGLVLVR